MKRKSSTSVVPYKKQKKSYTPYALNYGAKLAFSAMKKSSKYGSEVKFFEPTITTSAILTTGAICYESLLGGIIQGTGDNQRVGKKIQLKSIHLRGAVLQSSSVNTVDATTTVRIIIFHDKQCNGAAATVTGILETADEKAFNNLDNSRRFKVLKDWFFTMNRKGAGLNASIQLFAKNSEPLEFNKKVNIPIEYSGTGNGIVDLPSSNIGILAICSVVGQGVTLDTTVRVRYTDN